MAISVETLEKCLLLVALISRVCVLVKGLLVTLKAEKEKDTVGSGENGNDRKDN